MTNYKLHIVLKNSCKKGFYLLCLFIVSCTNQNTSSAGKSKKSNRSHQTEITPNEINESNYNKIDICWNGNLNGTTPIFIHYNLDEKLLVGEIVYINSKKPKPIKIIGELIGENYRILEFSSNGNVTGIITGVPTKEEFIGEWFSPKFKKTLKMELVHNDSVIQSIPFTEKSEKVYGNYHYQFSDEGYSGNFKFIKVTDKKASFNVFSVTDAPSRNIASLDTDTIMFNNSDFIYNIPYGNNCEMRVRFFKDFLIIDYPKKYCLGSFGMNATVEGIYLKVKK